MSKKKKFEKKKFLKNIYFCIDFGVLKVSDAEKRVQKVEKPLKQP